MVSYLESHDPEPDRPLAVSVDICCGAAIFSGLVAKGSLEADTATIAGLTDIANYMLRLHDHEPTAKMEDIVRMIGQLQIKHS